MGLALGLAVGGAVVVLLGAAVGAAVGVLLPGPPSVAHAIMDVSLCSTMERPSTLPSPDSERKVSAYVLCTELVLGRSPCLMESSPSPAVKL